MFDTMTLTKALGGVCGAFLIYLLGAWASQTIYGTGNEIPHEAAGAEHTMGYTIEVAAAAPKEQAAAPDFATLWAAADPAKGEKIFNKCKGCHSIVDGKNGTGPSLYGVVGRPVDSEPGYSYSGAFEKVVKTWTPENIFHMIKKPKEFAPGTKMGFGGLPSPTDRVDLIAYLKSVPEKK
jgi:cytochrome c